MRLLDTNVCVYIIRRRPPMVRPRLTASERDGLAISIITAMELEVGARRASATEYPRQIRAFLETIEVLPLAEIPPAPLMVSCGTTSNAAAALLARLTC